MYAMLAGGIIRQRGLVDGMMCILAIVLAVALADYLCAGVIRPAVERLRPSCADNPDSEIAHIVNGYRGGRFGFPSCHAANSFALASFLTLFYRTWKAGCLIIGWSLLLCWSRIYLGVHYPGDIAGGIAVGGICGVLMYCAWTRSVRLRHAVRHLRSRARRMCVLVAVLAAPHVAAIAQGCQLSGGSIIFSDTICSSREIPQPYKFRPTQLIIPAALIGTGVVGLESDWLKFQNKEMRDELQENQHNKFGADDIMQYVPMASAYALQLCGVKGGHDFIDKTIILGTAYMLMGAGVYGLKRITMVERPNGSARNSFPSGHTATAFMGAEFLRREYWHVSPWIGVAGYVVAAGTGFLRMYNNKHWLTDVIAGAEIGRAHV